MKNDSKNLLTVYYVTHLLFSLVFWLAFTSNHPLRTIFSIEIRQAMSSLFTSSVYFSFGYLAMLGRSRFLKDPFKAVEMMGLVLLVNILSAVIYFLTRSTLSLFWLRNISLALNYPSFLLLLADPLLPLNLAVIAMIPPFSYLIGLLLRQIYH